MFNANKSLNYESVSTPAWRPRILAALLIVSGHIASQGAKAEPDYRDEATLASRGSGVVTQGRFDARLARIPEHLRAEVIRDRGRLQDLINGQLLNAQLAADARAAGFDQSEEVQARMRLAAEDELVMAWKEHYPSTLPSADYEQLAREYYSLNKRQMLTPASIDVSHILISTREREPEAALALAEDVRAKAAQGAIFEDLVAEFSEDPSAASNKGRFPHMKRGEMVKPFEETAFALQVGELSAPVKTQYGYHLIRLNGITPAREASFDSLRMQLVERERNRHDERVRRDYLSSLTSLDVQMTQEALDAMTRRHFNESVLKPAAAGAEAKAADSAQASEHADSE